MTDEGRSALVLLASEQLTITTSAAVAITATLFTDSQTPAVPLRVIKGIFHLVSGGKIFHTETWPARATTGAEKVSLAAIADPIAGGTAGEVPQKRGDKFEVWPLEALKEWKAISQTGESDCKLNIELWGTLR